MVRPEERESRPRARLETSLETQILCRKNDIHVVGVSLNTSARAATMWQSGKKQKQGSNRVENYADFVMSDNAEDAHSDRLLSRSLVSIPEIIKAVGKSTMSKPSLAWNRDLFQN